MPSASVNGPARGRPAPAASAGERRADRIPTAATTAALPIVQAMSFFTGRMRASRSGLRLVRLDGRGRGGSGSRGGGRSGRGGLGRGSGASGGRGGGLGGRGRLG